MGKNRRTRTRTARPSPLRTDADAVGSSTSSGAAGKRARLARVVLLASGLVALASAFLVPFLNTAPFYRAVARPAFALSPELTQEEVDTLSPAQQEVLNSLELDALHALLGEPLPLEGANDESQLSLSAAESFALAAALGEASSEAGELRGETKLIARFMELAVLTLFLVGLVCLLMPLVPMLGAESTATIVVTGSAALLLLSSHLLSLSVDLVGVTTAPIFAWPAHVVSFALVFSVGLGSMLPMGLHNALRAVLGTMILTTVSLLGAALYVAL